MSELPINQIVCGDCLEIMKGWPEKSIQCCVTSPPYWGLRDYGVDGQLGLEKTPEEYVAKMVSVFQEVRRVLRDDGTLWLNLGSSYASGGNGIGSGKQLTNVGSWMPSKTAPHGFKHKDMVPIPWMVAMDLQKDGWYLRQDIVWHKPNPMPESCTDRCTKAHEYIFLLTKKPRYFYDAEAIKEPLQGKDERRWADTYEGAGSILHEQSHAGVKRTKRYSESEGRNKRSVWTVATKSFKEAHFATFPPRLIEPCILAGTSKKGCCPECRRPWERVVEKNLVPTKKAAKTCVVDARDLQADKNDQGSNRQKDGHMSGWAYDTKTTGWRSTCDCGGIVGHEKFVKDPIPCVVFDPFMGAGTVGVVSAQHGRDYTGIELSPEYCEMARSRLEAVDTGVPVKETRKGQMAMFK